MTRVRIAGAVLLVLLGAGLLTRITDRAGVPPKNPARLVPQVRVPPLDANLGRDCANTFPQPLVHISLQPSLTFGREQI